MSGFVHILKIVDRKLSEHFIQPIVNIIFDYYLSVNKDYFYDTFEYPFEVINECSEKYVCSQHYVFNINRIARTTTKHVFHKDIENKYFYQTLSQPYDKSFWAVVGRCNNGMYFYYEAYCYGTGFYTDLGYMNLYLDRNLFKLLSYIPNVVLEDWMLKRNY